MDISNAIWHTTWMTSLNPGAWRNKEGGTFTLTLNDVFYFSSLNAGFEWHSFLGGEAGMGKLSSQLSVSTLCSAWSLQVV
jgi:hypothetical protein